MTAEQFAYWLQGYAELNQAPPTAEQWQSIREHLALVFNKVTPPLAQPFVQPHTFSPTASPPDMLPRVTCSLPGHTNTVSIC